MLDGRSYTESFEMKYGEGDVLGRVRPATMMRCVEHVALKHASALGVTRAFNESHNMVFLIAKQAIEFKRMPKADEVLTFVTAPEQSKRITFRRVTLVYDANGAEVACIDCVWVLMDLSTRRLLRKSPISFDQDWTQTIERSVDLRIPKTTTLTTVGEVKARYAQCDSNEHLNNANYFDIICDYLSESCLLQKEIRRISINYHRELRLGQTMQIQTGEVENGLYLIGLHEGASTFEAVCIFED